MINQKGVTPLNIVYMGTLLIPAMANTVIPIGGVIVPICVITTTSTPNHMGSKPRLSIVGYSRGRVRIITGRAFMRQPKIKYINRIRARVIYRDTASPPTRSAKAKGSLVVAKNWLIAVA